MHKQMILFSVVALTFVVPGIAKAAYVEVYGGPTYDSSTSTGYQYPYLQLNPGDRAANGVTVADASRYDGGEEKGSRAIRWGVSGVTELAPLGFNSSGATSTSVYAINETGTSVGYAEEFVGDSFVGLRAVRWNASENTVTELNHLGTSGGMTESHAYGINSLGVAVGTARKFDGAYKGYRAVRWEAAGTGVTELGHLVTTIGGFTDNRAYAINTAGTIAGRANKYVGSDSIGTRAVRWDAGGTVATELGGLGLSSSGIAFNSAYAINDGGTAIGVAQKHESGIFEGERAVRWEAASIIATELGNLGLDSTGRTTTEAFAINSSGTVVGTARKYVAGISKGNRPVRWDASNIAAVELPNLGTSASGSTDGTTFDINDSGIVVGQVEAYDNSGAFLNMRAVMWKPDGTVIDLNTLIDPASGWVNLAEARGISNGGWVSGIGSFDPDGIGGLAAYDRLFLMQVPERTSFGGRGKSTRRRGGLWKIELTVGCRHDR